MSNLTDFIGGKTLDPRKFNRVDITTSQTYTTPYRGWYFVIVQGGGGGGMLYGSAGLVAGYGGLAGEVKYKWLFLEKGQNIDITIGSGGAGGSSPGAGGSSSFGAYITASGGAGGYSYYTSSGDTGKYVGNNNFGVYVRTDTNKIISFFKIFSSTGEVLNTNLYGLFINRTTIGKTFIYQDADYQHVIVGGQPSIYANGGNSCSSSGYNGQLGSGGGSKSSTGTVGNGGNGIVTIFEEV